MDRRRKSPQSEEQKIAARKRVKEWKANNPNKVKINSAKYLKKHKNELLKKSNTWKKEDRIKNPVKWATLARENRKKEVEKLSNSYIRERAKKNYGFSLDFLDANPEILETIKIIIKTKRLCNAKKRTK